jgi:hypothetical protein
MVDLFVVTRAAGMVPAESIHRQPVSPEGKAMIARLRAETLGVAPNLEALHEARQVAAPVDLGGV